MTQQSSEPELESVVLQEQLHQLLLCQSVQGGNMAAMLNVGDEFSTWAEFSEALEAFQEAHHVELSKVTSKTVANENRQLPQNVDKFPEEHIYRAVKFGCIHHGKPRSRSTGIRGNHASFKMGCPAEIYVSSDRKKRKLVIKTLNNNHNHEVNEEVLKLSPSKRILGGDFLEEACKLTRLRVWKF
uniref:ZSWIM3 N-terminal domain-containing protein n=1 Tax=Branchiostoma floridae TaxID=7739 RepID=C3Y5P4_BRAFL|eukprot:XP_002608281.1 hypothetical protein BRAFLDRAFT_87961 [Branchiostoma floridae]